MKILLISQIISLMLICNSSFGQDCNTQFSSHQNSSIITSYPVTVKGTARKPIGGHVWVLAHLRGFDGWYPQGNGERILQDTNWICAIYLGTPSETGYYEIAIAVVNDQINQSLNSWVSTARDRGYPPIPFPGVLKDCSISMITVEKR
jgi:hypothetical protein